MLYLALVLPCLHKVFIEIAEICHDEMNDSEKDYVVIIDISGSLLHTTIAGVLL